MAASDHEAVVALIAQKSSAPLNLPAGATALIVVDMQRAFVDAEGRFPRLMDVLVPEATPAYRERISTRVLPNTKKLIAAFREAALPIAFTGAGTVKGDGADLAGWLRAFDHVSRAALGAPVWPAVGDGDWAMDPSMGQRDRDILVRKTTADPFISTDLEQQLRSRGVRGVVVCGLTTDVCVAATARGAADRDFDTIVVEDACTTLSEQLHRASLDIIGLAFGRVVATGEILEQLTPATQRSAQLVPNE